MLSLLEQINDWDTNVHEGRVQNDLKNKSD